MAERQHTEAVGEVVVVVVVGGVGGGVVVEGGLLGEDLGQRGGVAEGGDGGAERGC